MKRSLKTVGRPTTLVAGASLLASGWLLPAPGRAADKYDTNLESRVEALERELNLVEGDKKGKDAEATEVPTFVKAGSANVKELVVSGEIRFRYAYDNLDGQPLGSNDAQSSRERFRLRLFADYKLTNNFFAGVALQTNQAADSGNQTYSEGFDNYNIYIWRAFVGYKNDWLQVVGGKQANQFYSNTELLYDADISPQGLFESVKIPVSPTFDLTFNAGQFIFNDNAENAFRNNPRTLPSGAANPAFVEEGNNQTDAYQIYSQIVGTFKPTNDLVFTGAGGFLFYPGHGGAGSTTAVNPAPGGAAPGAGTLLNSAAFNSAAATRNLDLGTVSADVKITLGAVKVKLYGDAVYNFRGGSRDLLQYGVVADDEADKLAFATGVTVGSDFTIKKKGDYLLLAEYRQVGLGSIDPNLNDSDFNLSRLGFRGVKVAASYGFYPWLIGSVTGFFNSNIGHENDVNIGVANANSSQTIEVDVTAKF